MGELLDLLAHGRVGGLPQARGAIIGSAGDGDQDVSLSPRAFVNDLAELVEVDLELRRTMSERHAIIRNRRISALPQFDQLVARAVEPIIMGVKLQAT